MNSSHNSGTPITDMAVQTTPLCPAKPSRKRFNEIALLPHEIFFGLLLVITWARLGIAAGWFASNTLIYAGLILLNVAAAWCYRSAKPWRARLGLLYYPLAMNFIFFHLKSDIPIINPHTRDALLWNIDTLLVGTSLSVRAQSIASPALTNCLSFCYALFIPYLLFSFVYYFCDEVALLRKFVVGLFSIYGIGFLGYTFVPALGPYHAFAQQFTLSLTGGWITHLNSAMVARGSNGFDAFPSLHCGVSSFILGFDRKYRPWRFRLYVLPCVGLWFSTIYLRYHYFIDVVCGFLLAGSGLWLAMHFPNDSWPNEKERL